MERILQRRIPEKLTRNTELDPLITNLKQEVGGDYDFSVRKSIGELRGTSVITTARIKYLIVLSQFTR